MGASANPFKRPTKIQNSVTSCQTDSTESMKPPAKMPLLFRMAQAIRKERSVLCLNLGRIEQSLARLSQKSCLLNSRIHKRSGIQSIAFSKTRMLGLEL